MDSIPAHYAVKALDDTGARQNTVLPEGNHTMALVAPRNCGKSTTLLHLITHVYKQKFHRILILNPTFFADSKWVSLLSKKDILLKGRNADPPKTYSMIPGISEVIRKKFDGKIPRDDIITDDFEETLHSLIETKMEMNDPHEKWLIICDDLAASGILKSDKNFLWAVLNGRHASVSIWYTAQTYSSLSRGLRLNTECWMLFTVVSNKKEILKMLDEHSMGLDQSEWLAIYDTVKRSGQYAFLTINYTVKDRRYAMTNSLRKFIRVE